jgi:hypothetical protein
MLIFPLHAFLLNDHCLHFGIKPTVPHCNTGLSLHRRCVVTGIATTVAIAAIAAIAAAVVRRSTGNTQARTAHALLLLCEQALLLFPALGEFRFCVTGYQRLGRKKEKEPGR